MQAAQQAPRQTIDRAILARPLDARVTPSLQDDDRLRAAGANSAPTVQPAAGTPANAPPDGFDLRLSVEGAPRDRASTTAVRVEHDAGAEPSGTPLGAREIALYLERIGFRGRTDPTIDTLARLHRAHLMAVPFENLDIMRGVPIVLDAGALFDKIVLRRRGGFCYELNGLFALLLRSIGFRVSLVSARVARNDGTLGPEFDHLALRVRLQEHYMADVGFGDGFTLPLPMRDQVTSVEPAGSFRLTNDGGLWAVERQSDGAWIRQYVFTTIERTLDDFATMCDFHQTSPLSHFTRRSICTRLTASGRITLSDNRLVELHHGERSVRSLDASADVDAVLRDRFGI